VTLLKPGYDFHSHTLCIAPLLSLQHWRDIMEVQVH